MDVQGPAGYCLVGAQLLLPVSKGLILWQCRRCRVGVVSEVQLLAVWLAPNGERGAAHMHAPAACCLLLSSLHCLSNHLCVHHCTSA